MRAEPLQTVLNGSQRAVFRIVVDDAVGPSELEKTTLLTEVTAFGFDLVKDQPTDLAAEQVFFAPVFGERFAQAYLGQARPVEGRRVEIASALLPSGIDRLDCFFFGNVARPGA